MKWLKAAYAQDYNYRHGRRGHVFGGRYYSVRLKSDHHLVAAIVYVSLNPLRAGVVGQPELWPWSGFAATIGLASPPPFLDRGAVLELFDSGNGRGREHLIAAVADTAARDRDVRQGSDPWGLTPSTRAVAGQVRPVGSDPKTRRGQTRGV